MIKLPHDIIGRAIADETFRADLFTNPREALAAANVSVDEATIAQLEALDLATVEKMLEAAGGEAGQAAAA